MNLFSQSAIKKLLKEYNLQPSKYLGQNFLINKQVLKIIIKTADISKNDLIIEVGPGLGTLTQELAKGAKKVIAIEKDPQMARVLKELIKNFKNVEIINKDILKLLQSPSFLPKTSYKVVANLPYYLTSPVIRMFLEAKNPPSQMILMVQKEVAQRICAKPGKMSILSVAVRFYGQPEIISLVSKNSFWPRPKVDSAILKIKIPPEPILSAKSEDFFKVVKAGFSSKRKQLINSLSAGLGFSREKTKEILKKARIDFRRRAQSLSLEEWQKIVESMGPN